MKRFFLLVLFLFSPLHATTCILWTPVIGEDRCTAGEVVSPIYHTTAGYTLFSMGTGGDSAEFEITDNDKLTVKNNNNLTAGNTYTVYVQAGNGTVTHLFRLSVEVVTGKVVPQVSSGFTNTTILDRDAGCFSAGDNGFGQIGDGTNTDRTTFTSISISGKTIADISTSRRGLALRCTDGTVYATGQNTGGQLGLNNGDADVNSPTQITTTIGSKWVVQVSAGVEDIHFLTSDASIYGAGTNTYGSVGNGTQTKQSAPVDISSSGTLSGKTVIKISGGNQMTAFLTHEGEVHICGRNVSGGLGVNNASDQSYLSPLKVHNTGTLDGGDLGGNVKEIGGKNGRNLQVITNSGKIYTTGQNGQGQLGIGNTTDQSTLTQMTSYTSETFLRIGAADTVTMLLTGTDVYAVGENTNERIVDSATSQYSSLQLIPGTDINNETPIAISCGNQDIYIVTATGKLFARGENSNGQLGLGNTTNPLAMTEVTGVDLAPGVGNASYVDTSPYMTEKETSTFGISWSSYEVMDVENLIFENESTI